MSQAALILAAACFRASRWASVSFSSGRQRQLALRQLEHRMTLAVLGRHVSPLQRAPVNGFAARQISSSADSPRPTVRLFAFDTETALRFILIVVSDRSLCQVIALRVMTNALQSAVLDDQMRAGAVGFLTTPWN